MEVQNKFCLWNANYISNFEFDITVYVPYVSTVQQTFWYSGRMTVIIIRLFLVENRPFLTPDVGPPHINFHIPIVRIYHRLLISKGHTMLDNISENDHRFGTLVFFLWALEYKWCNWHAVANSRKLSNLDETSSLKNINEGEISILRAQKKHSTTLTYFPCSLEEFPAHFWPITNGRARIFNISNILRSNCHSNVTPFRIDLHICVLSLR